MVAAKTVLKKITLVSKKGFDWSGRFFIWSAGVMLLLIILLQLLFWGGVVWLNSPFGQSTLQKQLGNAVSQDQNRIVIGGFSYIFPTKLHLGRVKIYQGDHEFVEINGLDLGADIFALSMRELPLFLKADKVTLFELPKKEDKRQEVEKQPVEFPIVVAPLSLPELPFDRVFLDDISIDELVIKGTRDIMLSPEISGRVDFFTNNLVSVELSYKDETAPSEFPKVMIARGQYHLDKSHLQLRHISMNSPLYSVSGKGDFNFSPEGDLSLDILMQANDVKDLSPLSVKLKACNVKDFVADLSVKGKYQEYAIDVRTSVKALGNNLHLKPINVKLPEVSVSGNISVDTKTSIITGGVSGKLSSINPYRVLIGNDHSLDPVTFNLDMKSESGKQKLLFKAATPTYQNMSSGLIFNDLNIKGDLLGEQLNITSITAKDKTGGTFNGSAKVDLKTMALDVSLSARDLNAVQGELANAVINMDMNVTGQNNAYKVKGEVRPAVVNVKLPERFAVNIPQINVVEPQSSQSEKTADSDLLSQITVDVDVIAPSQIFVRGWGLDSEFGGDIKIKGFADDPKFDGKFSVIRGRYSEFGRSFKLKKGELIFAGSVPPFPKLDVVTETKTGDVIARIEIKGTPESPEISFSSEPALPEDEVLSHILFGKNMDSITPFQAVKLTQTLQRFSGQGGKFSSFDPLDTVRNATGLDDLRVEADEEGAATVGAGKYLTDKVYLEFETGSGENSSNANIEIEVTPNITVESEIGEDAQGGAGVFWKWDY